MTGTVLVTGATGFIGGALCRLLVAKGRPVVAALRRGDAALPPAVMPRIVGEVGPDTDWGPALDGVDAVAHLAARVHVLRDRAADPLGAFRAVNTYGTRHLAEVCAAKGIRRLVFLSSIKAMGDGQADGRPYEEADPLRPTDAYGRCKAEAEAALGQVGGGLETVVLRPPLVYGPGVRGNFRSLLKLCDTPWPLPLGGLHNRRSLLALDNLVDAIALSLDHPRAAGRTYLLRDGEDLSTTDLAARIRAALGRPKRLVSLPESCWRAARALAPLRAAVERLAGSLTVDDGAIRRELGWRPPATVDEALAATIKAYRAS